MNDNEYKLLTETASRSRRIETRLTSYLASIGAYPIATPEWIGTQEAGYIEVEGLDTTLSACLRAIPEGYTSKVNVLHNGKFVALLDI